jgi:hypothetical protein
MEQEKNIEKYLEDNMDMIFGTECINGSFSIDLRNKLENNVVQKKDRTYLSNKKDGNIQNNKSDKQ